MVSQPRAQVTTVDRFEAGEEASQVGNGNQLVRRHPLELAPCRTGRGLMTRVLAMNRHAAG